MKNRNRILQFLISTVLIFSCLTGCTDAHDTVSGKLPYLNITESYFTDETQENMESICMVYDIGEQKLYAKGAVPSAGAVFPIASYSSENNSIFFSSGIAGGDQLYNYKSGKAEQLTDNFAAINYIFQCGDQLFLSAQIQGNNLLEPILFDWGDNTINRVYPDEKDDRLTSTATCDPAAEKVYFSYYSDTENRKKIDERNENGEVLCASSIICSLDVHSGEVSQIYQTEDYVWGIAVSGNTLYYGGAAGPFSENVCYIVDLKTGEKTELPLSVTIKGDMAIWDNVLYVVGVQDDIRGIYAVDLSDLSVDLIYKAQPNGQSIIHGMSLNY